MLKKAYYQAIVIITFFMILGGCSSKDTQKQTQVVEPPSPRIISLKPNITEILMDLEVGKYVVGVTTFCSDPRAAGIAHVADYVNVDVEKVLSLKPTLIIGSFENSERQHVDFLKNQGIGVELFSFGTLEEITKSIRQISVLLKIPEKGESLAQKLENTFEEIKKKSANRKPYKTLVIVGKKPLVVVGGANLFDDILKLYGLENVVQKSVLRYPVYSWEQVLAANPDIILDFSLDHERLQNKDEALKEYQKWDSIPAVQNKRIYFLEQEKFHPSMKVLEGLKDLDKIFETL